jgi:hypothetical protein
MANGVHLAHDGDALMPARHGGSGDETNRLVVDASTDKEQRGKVDLAQDV